VTTYSKRDDRDGAYIVITEDDRVYELPFRSEINRDEAWRCLVEEPQAGEVFSDA
jgi:hypothetical protein